MAQTSKQTQRFDVLVLEVGNEKARHLIARHLALDPAISLEQARAKVASPPVVDSTNLEPDEAARRKLFLERLGARVKLVPSRVTEPPPVSSPEPDATPSPPPVSPSARSLRGAPARQPRVCASVSFGDTPSVRSRWSGRVKAVAAVIMTAVVVAIMFWAQSRRTFRLKALGPLPGGATASRIHEISPDDTTDEGASRGGRAAVRAEDKERASALVDSVLDGDFESMRAIRFFKIALSFNRYNAAAWYGLVNAYRDAGMDAEAAEAEERMRKIFGEGIARAAELIWPYGTLSDFSEGSDGVCRLEYRTRTVGRGKLLQQAHAVVRGLAEAQTCKTVSLYAATGKGKGLLVHVRADRAVASDAAFEREATISYLE